MNTIDRRALLGLVAATPLIAAGPASRAMAAPYPGADPKTWPNKAPASPTLPRKAPNLFDANFDYNGFSRYKNFHPTTMRLGTDAKLVRDPLGSGPVALLDSSRRLSHGNNHPRASLEAPVRILTSARGNLEHTYAHRVKFYLPPAHALRTSAQWNAFLGVHGAPWVTGSRTGLMMVFDPTTSTHFLRMGDDRSLLSRRDTAFRPGQWVDVLVHFRYDYARDGGWVRLYMARSGSATGWYEVPIAGKKGGFTTDVISATEGSGHHHDPQIPAATPRVGIYGRPMRLLIAEHRLATQVKWAMDGRWDQKIDGKPFAG